MDRWATFDIREGPIQRIFSQRMGGGRCQLVSCGCPVLRRGGCPGLMSLVSRDGVKGCAMRRSQSLSPARCRARCLVGVSCRVCGLNGVGAYKACHRRNNESLSGSGRESCEGCISSGSSRLKRPSVCSPVLPVNDSLERDQSPCGRGSIVVCRSRL